MPKRETAVEVRCAEHTADFLRAVVARLEGVSWELDSALSSRNKDDVGYRRANAANPDGGPNGLPGEIAEAERLALDVLRSIPWGVGCELSGYHVVTGYGTVCGLYKPNADGRRRAFKRAAQLTAKEQSGLTRTGATYRVVCEWSQPGPSPKFA